MKRHWNGVVKACIAAFICCLLASQKVHAFLYVSIDLGRDIVETTSCVYKYPGSLYGIGSNTIRIEFSDSINSDKCIFESLGCSDYRLYHSCDSLSLEVYSDLSTIWSTDCCIQDMPPFDIENCEIKYTFIYTHDGLRGEVEILNMHGDEHCAQDMDYVCAHPELYCDLINGIVSDYYATGVPVEDIYNFLLRFDNSIRENDIPIGPEDNYPQYLQIYKFALENAARQLDLVKLAELGEITTHLNEFYGNKRYIVP